MSAIGSVKQNLSGKERGKALSCGCYHALPRSHRAMGWSAMCDCGSSKRISDYESDTEMNR